MHRSRDKSLHLPKIKGKRVEARQPAATFGMPAPRNDGRRIQGVLDGAGKLLGIMRVAYRRNNVNKNIIV